MNRTALTIVIMVAVVIGALLLIGFIRQPPEPLELSLTHNLNEGDYQGEGPRLTIRPESVYRGREVSVTAGIFPGYRFSRWETEDGTVFSEEPTERFVIEHSMTLRAVYEPHEGGGRYYIGVSSNQDVVIDRAPEQPPPFYYDEGTQLSLIAPDIEGYRFDHYRDETTDELLSTSRIYTFMVDSDQHIKAVYAPEGHHYILFDTTIDDPIVFTINDEPYDDIIPFEDETLITIEAPIVEGYGFVHWINREGQVVSENRIFDYLIEGTDVLTAVYNEARLAYRTGFEDAVKMSYADGSITTQGRTWQLDEALIASSHLDQRDGENSVRFRGGHMQSHFRVTDLERIGFYAGTFGDDPEGSIHVQLSVDGEVWHTLGTVDVTETFTYDEVVVLEDKLDQFGLALDDAFYIRLVHESQDETHRINLDNLRIYVTETNDNFLE